METRRHNFFLSVVKHILYSPSHSTKEYSTVRKKDEVGTSAVGAVLEKTVERYISKIFLTQYFKNRVVKQISILYTFNKLLIL
jgi:hypothetical protein